MGVSKTSAFLLNELSVKGMLKGDLLQLGVQRISRDSKTLINSHVVQENVKPRVKAVSSKKQFWHNLGFESVTSLDYSDFEGAEIIWDLNLPLNDSFSERFDVVFDGGTMEHVFDTSSVLGNIGKLLKVGGLVIHEVPSSNSVDHGLYSFSPTLFRTYYSNHHFELIEILLIVKDRHKAKVYQYFPRVSNTEVPENWGKSHVNVWCVAKKKSDTDQLDTLQQTKYVNAWSETDHAIVKVLASRQKIKLFRRKVKSLVILLSKKSKTFALLARTFHKKSKTRASMVLKYRIKGKFGDFV